MKGVAQSIWISSLHQLCNEQEIHQLTDLDFQSDRGTRAQDQVSQKHFPTEYSAEIEYLSWQCTLWSVSLAAGKEVQVYLCNSEPCTSFSWSHDSQVYLEKGAGNRVAIDEDTSIAIFLSRFPKSSLREKKQIKTKRWHNAEMLCTIWCTSNSLFH